MNPQLPIQNLMTSVSERLVVPLIEESLVVDKRVIDQGGYRIVKRVEVREEVVDEPLLAHTVQVERRAIGRLLPSMEIPASRQEGDTLIVSIVEEVLVTEKRLMLKEELHITHSQAVTHHAETFSLRSEHVAIERLEPGTSPTSETP
ncbi:MAG: DUF2382 domain-containing protein [Pseudomonas sp.]|nr:MAG: DUF2382 domain-containing protein [Pseudomonas sp.]